MAKSDERLQWFLAPSFIGADDPSGRRRYLVEYDGSGIWYARLAFETERIYEGSSLASALAACQKHSLSPPPAE